MGVSQNNSFDATVTTTGNKQAGFSALVVSATLSAMAATPHAINPQLTFSVEQLNPVTQVISETDEVSAGQGKVIEDERESLEVKVSTFTKDELNAKLAQNKAEGEAISANMKTEMANFRTAYTESFSEISKTLSRLEAKADATEKRLTQAQWIVSLVISICAVTLSAVIFFSNKYIPRTQNLQPVSTQSIAPSEREIPSSSGVNSPKPQ